MDWEEIDANIVDTAITSRKPKREEFKKIIKIAFVCVVYMIMGVVAWHDNSHFVKEPIRKWELERRSHLNRLIRGLEIDCFEQLRVSKSVFFKLCRNLQEGDGLVRTRNVPITQAMVMFLHIVAHNLEYRVVHLDYYRSKETISSQFNNVLRDVMKVSEDYLKFHTYNLEGLEAIKWSWFEVSLSIVRLD